MCAPWGDGVSSKRECYTNAAQLCFILVFATEKQRTGTDQGHDE